MDNMDDQETTAKISDSAYSNSCSNSQSRRSHSSKSTHSGSHSSGSSGYGGKPSTSGSSNTLNQPPKKDKDSKKKKLVQTETTVVETSPAVEPARPLEPAPVLAAPQEEPSSVAEAAVTIALPEELVENQDTPTPAEGVVTEKTSVTLQPLSTTENNATSCPLSSIPDGFSCVISMHDGVVVYTTAAVSTTLGYPKDVWLGRSFIDFIHPKDHKLFSSLITNGLAVPKVGKDILEKDLVVPRSTMVCRVRQYRSLNGGFGIKDVVMTFMPFLLKFSFKNTIEEDGKMTYLVIQATPFLSAYKIPKEIILKPTPFTLRHDANGIVEYIDLESGPYLGYLPQDLQEKDAIQLYHPDDMPFLIKLYESVIKEGSVSRSKAYRMKTNNGDFIKLETEWSSVVNPWSMKLECIIGKHHVIEGPSNPDVFQLSALSKSSRTADANKYKIKTLRECFLRVMNEVRTKPAEAAKKLVGKRCQELASFMETLVEEPSKTDEEQLELEMPEMQERDLNYYERDTDMLGGISPHHDSESKSSVETPISYTQLNYNDNLQRFFESQIQLNQESYYTIPGDVLGQKEYHSQRLRSMVDFSQGHSLSSTTQKSSDTNDLSSHASSSAAVYETSPGRLTQCMKLTESLLHKHNVEMENKLVKVHRETRSSKGDREKALHESRKNKKEHLARCKASFYPTMSSVSMMEYEKEKQHGTKRPLKVHSNDVTSHKLHCPSSRECQRRQPPTSTSSQFTTVASVTTPSAGNHWPLNPFMYGVSLPQQISMMAPDMTALPGTSGIPLEPGTSGMHAIHGTSRPSEISAMPVMPAVSVVPGIPAMYPMYYAGPVSVPSTSNQQPFPSTIGSQPVQAPVPYVMHSQPTYGHQPFVYTAVNTQMYPMQHPMPQQVLKHSSTPNALSLPTNNYEQNDNLKKPLEVSQGGKSKNASDADRTDGESSYSSFYSSFFKTDSGSAEDSGDQNKKNLSGTKNRFWTKNMQGEDAMSFQSSTETGGGFNIKPNPAQPKKLARRKMEAPWNEKVNLTSELIYRYQVVTKPLDEVLETDKKKIATMEQPSLVNEQLEQLYLDLHLQGVAAKLTLEEGITSSSSSGEETIAKKYKTGRAKREYSRLVMIHEEDAPMPPAGTDPPIPDGLPDDDIIPIGSTT